MATKAKATWGDFCTFILIGAVAAIYLSVTKNASIVVSVLIGLAAGLAVAVVVRLLYAKKAPI